MLICSVDSDVKVEGKGKGGGVKRSKGGRAENIGKENEELETGVLCGIGGWGCEEGQNMKVDVCLSRELCCG